MGTPRSGVSQSRGNATRCRGRRVACDNDAFWGRSRRCGLHEHLQSVDRTLTTCSDLDGTFTEASRQRSGSWPRAARESLDAPGIDSGTAPVLTTVRSRGLLRSEARSNAGLSLRGTRGGGARPTVTRSQPASLRTDRMIRGAGYFLPARLPAAMITSRAKPSIAHQAMLSVSFCHLTTSHTTFKPAQAIGCLRPHVGVRAGMTEVARDFWLASSGFPAAIRAVLGLRGPPYVRTRMRSAQSVVTGHFGMACKTDG